MARLCPPGKLQRALDQLEHDFGSGLEALEALARTYSKDPDVRAALGMVYLDDEQPFAALPHLEWSERKDPTPSRQEALLATYVALDMPHHALRLAVRSPHLSHELDREAPTEAGGVRDDGLSTQDRLAFERARTGIMHGEKKAAADMERLLVKRPGYQPARNLLVTDKLLQGDLEGYVEAAAAAFAQAPGDPHALLNAARAALLHGGVDAARALRPRADALVPDGDWGGDRYLARAGALALMDDADGTEAALSAYHDWVQETGDDSQAALAEALDDLLERRRQDPRAPLIDLRELIAGVVSRWKATDTGQLFESVGESLANMPGLLRELPNWIGYQRPEAVRLLTVLLLHDVVPPPPQGSWAAVFEAVARHGPGTHEARRTLLLLLSETGHLDEDEVFSLDGDDRDDAVSMRLHRLEISGEGLPSDLPEADEAIMTAALEDMRQGRTAKAFVALGTLLERYPDSLPLAYNLALAERLSGGEAAHRGRERLERLVDEHPDYLVARAELALMAIDDANLNQAESLLALREEKRHFHAYEWGVFAAASGRLALARGDASAAEGFLEGIAKTLGHGAAPYRALDDAIDRFHFERDSDLDVLDEDAFDDDDPFDENDDEIDDEDDDDDDELEDGLIEDDDDELEDGLIEDDDDENVVQPPDLDELSALPTLDEHWCIEVRPAVFMIGEDPEATLTWLGAIADQNGLVRLVNVEPEAFGADALYRLFAQACAGGMVAARQGRPRRVSLADAVLAEQLAERIEALGVDVGVGDTDPAAAGVHALSEALGGGVPSWLADAEDDQVEDFFEAVEYFYDVQPWHRFSSDRFVAFRVGDGPWRYANVMGQADREYGLVVFEVWPEPSIIGRGVRGGDSGAAQRLSAVGSVESLSLTPIGALSPLDAGCYLAAGVKPRRGSVAALLRFEGDGIARPEHGPGVYAVLIEVLAEQAQRSKQRVRRIDVLASTPAGRLRVHYPATGDEHEREPATPSAGF
jgi:hypothetical protein